MKRKIVALIVVFIMIFGFTGCSTTKNINKAIKKGTNAVKKQVETKKEVNIVGTYSLIEMKSESQSYTENDLKQLKEAGLEVKLELKEDKTAELDLFGTKQNLTYDSKYFYSNDEKIVYSYADGILLLTNGNQSLKFEIQK